MKRSPILSAAAVALSASAIFAAAAFAQTAPGGPVSRWVIEDGEQRAPQGYYDEKPPVLETTAAEASEGTHSLHFISGTGYGGGYIAKSRLAEPVNLAAIAANGTVSFDLWVNNPQDVRDVNAGSLFEFRIGSSDNNEYTTWLIPSSLLKAGAWNRVVLRLNDGLATLAGSSVRDVPLSGAKDAGVDCGAVDWTAVDYHRLALYCADKTVEGYLDNMTAQALDAPLPANRQTLPLSMADPDSHFFEAKRSCVENTFWPTYQIIPMEIRSDAFLPDDILHWENGGAWTAAFENCGASPVFCLSWDQAIRGVRNVKIEAQASAPGARIVLTPASPIRINKDFDVLDFWVYGRYHHNTLLGFTFKLPDGTPYTWLGGAESHSGTGELFNSWSLGHAVLPRLLPSGTSLVSIQLVPPAAGNFLFHLDQMRVLNKTTYLAQTPAPVYRHLGKPVKLPVNPAGACPSSAEAVKTAVTLTRDAGSLRYTSASGDTVTYTCRPRTGTLSDISVEVSGRSSFLPADGGGPTFDFGGKTFTAASDQVKTTCLSSQRDGDGLQYVWRYATPAGSTDITWRFSLKGKTLQIELSSGDRYVSSFGLGHASGLHKAEVVKVPFMIRGPGVLCNDGFFTTLIPDWYKTNFSRLSFNSERAVHGDTAVYTYDDPGISYLPRTDGKRWPLKDTLYITTSSTFEDCLPNISNPPSPFKDVLKERLYRLASPVDYAKPAKPLGWVEASKAMVDQYAQYGMTKLYITFHAGMWTNCGARGPEPFHSRMTTSVATPGGDKAVISLFRHIKDLGMYPGFYAGCDFWQPISQVWDYNSAALKGDGSFEPTWVQAYHPKPWYFAELTSTFYRKQAEKLGGQTVYEDGWTAGDLWDHTDYDHRVSGSGRFLDTLQAVATGYRNERKSVGGPVFSEGDGCCFYTAGLNDGDYGKILGYANRQLLDVRKPVLLVDFELRKVAPLHAPVSLDLGYWRFCGGEDLTCGDFRFLHHFLATQIAFGTIGMMEPYARLSDEPYWKFDSVLTCYFMMQQIQKRYIMEKVEDIRYFDGQKLLTTSDAVRSGAYLNNMLRIRYANGLVICINCNYDGKNWVVEDGGKKFDLPSGGWYARQGKSFVEYSATVDGRRVDFVDSPAYTYVNANGKAIKLAGLSTEKIALRHKTGRLEGKILTYPR